MIILTITLGLLLLALTCSFGRAGIARLARLQFRSGTLVLLALVAQLISVSTHQFRLELLLVSTVLMGIFCWRNAHHAGITLAAAGIILNMAVMALNGGTMPLNPQALEQMSGVQIEAGTAMHGSKNVVMHDEQAILPWLGDRLLLPGPLGRLAAWSIGDVFLLIGVGWLLWKTMKGPRDVAERIEPRAVSPLL